MTATSQSDCTGASREAARTSYSCPQMFMPIVLPGDTMVSMTAFDFDTGPLGDYTERLVVPEYAYFRTPLRPS